MIGTSARVAVIGGGIAGAAVAFGLASRDASVTIFDDASESSCTDSASG